MDKLVAAGVQEAIRAVQDEDEPAILAALKKLERLDKSEVIGDLILWVDDVTANVARDELLAAARLPFPEQQVRDLLDAVAARDLDGIEKASGSDQLDTVFATLLLVTASLKTANPHFT